jgi:hypothetical protein
MEEERAEAFFLCERRRQRRIPMRLREQLQKGATGSLLERGSLSRNASG